ncbi:MAG: hypothetical protein ABI434_00510 [Burkholderiaceae bacterium]
MNTSYNTTTPSATADVGDSIQGGLASLRNDLPAMATRLQTQTETYVRDQPVKAVLLAVAAGAVLAKLLGRSNHGR